MKTSRIWLIALVGLAACGDGHGGSTTDASTEGDSEAVADCTPGQPDCRCREDGTCAGMLTCEDTGDGPRCKAPECMEGTEDCPCDDGRCDQGLSCSSDELCIAARGGEGQDCFPNNTCEEGLHCEAGRCESCTPGVRGCTCHPGGSCTSTSDTCNERLLCVDAATIGRKIPRDRTCYTPCKTGFTDAKGTYRACSADGLMAECLDDLECVDGSCVAEGHSPPSCAGDVECPDHQLCIQGRCYSNCEYNSDCATGEGCHRHACRTPCRADQSSCADGTHCELLDSEHGYCMPLAAPSAETATEPVDGTYEVSEELVALSNVTPGATLTITNHAPRTLAFTLHRVEQTLFEAAGPNRSTDAPMPWLRAGLTGKPNKDAVVELGRVPGNGGSVQFTFATDTEDVPSRWEGVFEVRSDELGSRRISLSYAAQPEGRWAGKVYYFGQFGDDGLDAWMANRGDANKLDAVGNAFVKKLGGLRHDRITLEEFDAMLRATVTESWRWPSVQALCPKQVCYLFAPSDAGPSDEGWRRYTDSPDEEPVPSGLVELPIALDLKMEGLAGMSGRIASSESLHYAADPFVTLQFESDPSKCSGSGSVSDACAVPLQDFRAQVVVGGRYRTTSADPDCSAVSGAQMDFVGTPWLVPGFIDGTEIDKDTGLRYSYECRDNAQPFANPSRNASVAAANPIPDGKRRLRQVELVDGALVNQEALYILFRERFAESFLGGVSEEFYAYGFMRLERANAALEAEDFAGNSVPLDNSTTTVDVASPTACDAQLTETILGHEPVTINDWTAFWSGLLTGVPEADQAQRYGSNEVHYLCHATGLFDTGPSNADAPATCPPNSGVTYFAAPNTATIPGNLGTRQCQHDGSCQEVLDAWTAAPPTGFQLNPARRCTSSNQVFCDQNRLDLRDGQVFFKPGQGAPKLLPLRSELENAFRYRTQFQNRQGEGLAFVPDICVPNSNIVPYCYEPSRIEEVRQRVDCLVSTYNAHYEDPVPVASTASTRAAWQQVRGDVADFLEFNFGYEQLSDPTLPRPVRNDGFELLNAELLIMLGDESYTDAFQSRFDLAGTGQVSFEGSLFEPDGIDLAGVAGFELYTLYQATQYYQMVLERFYALSPAMWEAIDLGGTARNFVTLETVVGYFSKVLRASTQKSRAWSEIGKRYQAMNRPQLARFALERAYTSAYLESIVLMKTMQRVYDTVEKPKGASIAKEIENGQRTYKIAMLDMREVYSTFTDNITYFGFEPDYIPMPALEPNGPDAFRTLLVTAQQSLAAASVKEDLAISSDRSFETDAAEFQSELAKIRSTYENQLTELCGTLRADNGQIYPAIPKYAYSNRNAAAFGDPCGLVGNGGIYRAMAELDLRKIDVQAVLDRFDRLLEEIEIEKERANKQCNIKRDLADFRYETQGKVNNLSNDIRNTRLLTSALGRRLEVIKTVASLSKCSIGLSPDCPAAAASMGVFMAASMANLALTDASEASIASKESEIAELQRESAWLESEFECEAIMADSNARVRQLLLDLKGLELEALRTEYQVRIAISDIGRLRDQATRIMAEQDDTEQLAINIQAAKNDPNVRIYKNDAIINADKTFFRALQDAYRATKVYEYYTSQSYARLDALTLVRLVSRGDYNLENYLAELADAFYGFEEEYGRPDTRVDILSLRDDILGVPRYDEAGRTLSQSERTRRFREAISSTDLLDARGYIVVPFSTSLDRLSPLTRNHKILYLEGELIGSDLGDGVGRIYVGQAGTGTVAAVDGERLYFRFPERTAVIDPFFNGVRTFTPAVYRNDRMRDRPYANTAWEFVLNQRDEQVNRDINLDALSDIRLYVYYTDFTSF